ncbi:M1 family metallopeptidase [Acetobacter sacchari]|uniref:M1 family metallopeptidase n=2 Tax=Acetobacter sacchari TaxID=2661687 RepID=A0ABS3LY11_9PROT|nr:M1 family metallopeptidase [Acetobacter sacchari]
MGADCERLHPLPRLIIPTTAPFDHEPDQRHRNGRRVSPRLALLACAALVATACPELSARAADQTPPGAPPPEPSRIFAPLASPQPVNAYRSGSGAPGPLAWQNGADYDIKVSIDPTNKTVTGSEVITYTNNSPGDLDTLWVQLDQNIYKEGARADFSSPERHANHTDGFSIESVSVGDDGHTTPIQPLVSDTRMQTPLPQPLPKGGKIKLRIAWHYTVPGPWGGRTSVTPSKNGDIYEIAQFYPRMAVYDDIRGWDTAPYLGQEFYLDYGDFDYSVTVPANFIVVGSGALANPAEVLSQEQRDRLVTASKSDQRVMIRTQADVEAAIAPPPAPVAATPSPAKPDAKADAKPDTAPATKTWRFHMSDSRDVAFVASAALLWDAAKLDLPPVAPAPGKPPAPRLAMSVYPVEGIGSHGWDRSTSYVKHAIEYFSEKWYPYPWPNAINVGGHGAGMEYPGIVFDGMQDRDPMLFWITTHELGHGWFPMIVGSNERRNAFMDEGFNTFIDALASDHFNHGEFAPKHDSEYAPDTGKPADDIIKVLKDPDAPVLMAPSDVVSEKYRHPVTYFKAAYGLTLLREQILGPDRFDRAFRRYISLWAFHHPTPSDFFRLMDSEAGEDLSWFWRGWYFNNWAPDYAIKQVSYVDGDPKKGALVQVANHGWLPLPVVLQITWADGSSARMTLPTETWMLRNEITLQIPGSQQIRTAVLDPDRAIPDVNRADNSYGAVPTATPQQH